jgi:hypothetical protein
MNVDQSDQLETLSRDSAAGVDVTDGLVGKDRPSSDFEAPAHALVVNRNVAEDDLLVFPMGKSAVAQYSESSDSPRELKVFYGDKEISFDDPEQFAFGEALVKQTKFVAKDALNWSGSGWPRVSEMLDQLIEHGVLRYADDSIELALGIDREDRVSPLPPATFTEPKTWLDCENVMRELTGHPLEIGYIELVVPIFRVAHMFLDADDRQVGEANVFPPPLRLDRPTQWRTCTYPGTRYQPDRPMNVTALKAMRVHWRQMMAVLLKIREAYFKRFPDARNGWTVGDIERVSVAVLALPSYMLLRNDNPVENGKLHPVLSSLFRVTDGLRMTMHQMLFTPFGEPTRSPSTPMTGSEVFAYAERNHSLHTEHGVCAGPQFMIEEFLAVILNGEEPKSGMPKAIDPDVQEAIDHIEPAMDYAMLGLQAFAAMFSTWPAMTAAYSDLHGILHSWAGPTSPSLDKLRARFDEHNEHVVNDTFLVSEEWRDNRMKAYSDMYAKCGFGRTGAYPDLPFIDLLNSLSPMNENDKFTAVLRQKFAEYLSDLDDADGLAKSLAKRCSQFFHRQQSILRLAGQIQSNTNILLSRANPKLLFTARDVMLYNIMQGHEELAVPYMIDEIGHLLDIDIDIDSKNIDIRSNLN